MPDDLWPDNLLDPEAFSPPIAIVRQQARLLGQRTGNVVMGSVDRLKSEDENFRYSFNLTVPSLSYRFSLFVLEYNVEGFPVHIILDERVARELRIKQRVHGRAVAYVLTAGSENELVGILRLIFAAEKTRSIIRTLVAQAEEEG